MTKAGTAADNSSDVFVRNEIGTLKRVLMHYPDAGIGQVVPTKAQEWLYEDIVDLNTMREEYASFRKLLLAYLDPEVLTSWFAAGLGPEAMDPTSEHFLKSGKVLEVQSLLAEVLEDSHQRTRLVSSVCALEQTSQPVERFLLDEKRINAQQLANVLITGFLNAELVDARLASKMRSAKEAMEKHSGIWVFAPIPNFVFTRDIGITIGNRVLLSRFATQARRRESLLSRYIITNRLLSGDVDRTIEVADNDELFLESAEEQDRLRVTIEGGDVMMIGSSHLLVGCSERTSPQAVYSIIESLFGGNGGVEKLQKVSVVKIPQHRSCMHIDTVFTQVRRDTWVLFEPLSKRGRKSEKSAAVQALFGSENLPERSPLQVLQFLNKKDDQGDYSLNPEIHDLEDLLTDVSVADYGCEPEDVNFIYSGDGKSPDGEREQWTDSCNVVAIKEGVVVGYDRNVKTAACFETIGYNLVSVTALVDKMYAAWQENSDISIEKFLAENVGDKALLMIDSAELSRARGGPHCMTMPILRDDV